MRSGVSEGRSGPRSFEILLFVTVVTGISSSLSLEISLAFGTVALYSIYYIIVKYMQQKVVIKFGRRTG
jgi:hypothetical protein